jgi:hypothetical protein
VGWWSQTTQDHSTPLGRLPAAPAPDVPEGGLPVTATLGQPTRVSGIGVGVDAAPGAVVEVAVLTLTEVGGLATEAAGIVACPILEFWVEGPNQPYDALPELDCERAVPGLRSEDGTWTFDLAPIAEAWLDLGSGIDPNGVALVPAPGTTGSFQVVFDGQGATVDLQAAGGDPGDPFGPPPGGDPGGGFDGGGFDGGGFGGGGFASPDFGDPGGFGFDPIPAPDPAAGEQPVTDPGDADGAPGGPGEPAEEVTAPVAHPGQVGATDIPGPVLLLLPLALVLAGVTAYSLGPAGEPIPADSGRTIARALATHSRLEVPDDPPPHPSRCPVGRVAGDRRLRPEAKRGPGPDRRRRVRR